MKKLIILITAVIFFGCATPNEVMYDSAKRNPTPSLDFYREGTKPTRPYKEIGEIAFETFSGEDSNARKELIERGKELGANGLIMLPRLESGYQFNPFGRSGNKYVWKAVAVVYE